MLRSFDGSSAGAFNAGRYSNARLDALIDAIRVAPDLAQRRQLIGEALTLIHTDLPLLPLYRIKHSWVMRPTLQVVPWPNSVLELRWVRMDG
jgi:peptide/nickel transport system substrate-binding protein